MSYILVQPHVIREILFFLFPKWNLPLCHTFPFLRGLSPAKALYETLGPHGGYLANLTVAVITSEVRVFL